VLEILENIKKKTPLKPVAKSPKNAIQIQKYKKPT